jgi:outer membrane protein assembly factor BamB
VAYSAASGSMLWQKDLGLNANPHIGASDGTLYLSLGNSFAALRGSDGSVLWQHSLDTPITVDPVVVNGTLYFNYYGEVFAFNAADGSPRWHYRPQQLFDEGATTLAVGGGFIFAGSGTSVIALHATDGSLTWSKAYPRLILGTAYSDGVVYVSWEDPSLPALHVANGSQLWSAQLMGGHAWPAVVAGNTVFVGMNPGTTPNGAPAYVYALRPGDGSVMWQLTATSDGFVSAPVVA